MARPTKRERILQGIAIDCYLHGEAGRLSIRAYVENRISMEAFLRACREGLEKRKRDMAHGTFPYHLAEPNPVGISLYSSFHGNPPARLRRIKVAWPKKGEKLVKIGRLVRVNYVPEWPSTRRGTEFYHRMGDTGARILKNKPILATREDGTGLFIIPDKAQTRFSRRGIVG